MTSLEAALLIVAGTGGLLLAGPLTALVIPLARRRGFVDQPGGHKSHRDATPYGGGIAIFGAVWLPLGAVWLLGWWDLGPIIEGWLGAESAAYWGGLQLEHATLGWLLLGGAVLHALGLYDDRRAIGALPKLLVMILVAGGVAWLGDVRVAEAIVGAPLAIIGTAGWLLVVMNAFNFLDNMDGLSAGIATICLLTVMACGLLAGQLFVPALACLVAGSLVGFLLFNFPPAMIFMGDAGSLVVGYLVGVCSVLTTYYQTAEAATPYALAMPLVILAIPLYDFVSVLTIRFVEGRALMRGDQRHFSHRLLLRGLNRRNAVLTIYLATAATGLLATLLPQANLRETLTVAAAVLSVLAIVAILEAPLQKTS
jgi:UDP-GlcNAc:undecaprenyl-phosphate GlcNAc-1-phosphate transferase